jgi:hypothetical protein
VLEGADEGAELAEADGLPDAPDPSAAGVNGNEVCWQSSHCAPEWHPHCVPPSAVEAPVLQMQPVTGCERSCVDSHRTHMFSSPC